MHKKKIRRRMVSIFIFKKTNKNNVWKKLKKGE